MTCLECLHFKMRGCAVPGFGTCERELSKATSFSPLHACHNNQFSPAPAETVAKRISMINHPPKGPP